LYRCRCRSCYGSLHPGGCDSERVEASIEEAEARATSIEREARERVLKMEVGSATSLAFIRREASELTRRVAFLEGEL
jgi:hypothetical protein